MRMWRTTCRYCQTSFLSGHPGCVTDLAPGRTLAEQCPHCGHASEYPRSAYHRQSLCDQASPAAAGTTGRG